MVVFSVFLVFCFPLSQVSDTFVSSFWGWLQRQRNNWSAKYIWTVQYWGNVCVHGVLHQKKPLIPLLQLSLGSCPCGPDSAGVCFLILQVWVTDTQGRRADGFYKWFHPKGAWWRELLTAVPTHTLCTGRAGGKTHATSLPRTKSTPRCNSPAQVLESRGFVRSGPGTSLSLWGSGRCQELFDLCKGQSSSS